MKNIGGSSMEWVAAKESIDRYMTTLDIETSKQKIMTAREVVNTYNFRGRYNI